MNSLLVVEQYERMPTNQRQEYLDAHVQDITDLPERFLLEALRSEPDPAAKWYLVKGLGILRSTAAIPLIISLCKGPDVDLGHTTVHAICAWSLGRIGDAALPHVMELLREQHTDARRCAVDALGELRNPAAIPALCVALESDEHPVRLWAALSLAKIGDAAIPSLHAIIERSNDIVRLLALDAIIKISNQDSVQILRNLLRYGNREEKKLILEQGRAFHASLVDVIKECARSMDSDVAKVAVVALTKLGNKPRGAS